MGPAFAFFFGQLFPAAVQPMNYHDAVPSSAVIPSRLVYTTYSRREEEEVESSSSVSSNVHFTSTLPSAVCESPSDGDSVTCPRVSVGTGTRTLFGCFGGSEDSESWLEELAELDGCESVDAIIHQGIVLTGSGPMGLEMVLRTVLGADHD